LLGAEWAVGLRLGGSSAGSWKALRVLVEVVGHNWPCRRVLGAKGGELKFKGAEEREVLGARLLLAAKVKGWFLKKKDHWIRLVEF